MPQNISRKTKYFCVKIMYKLGGNSYCLYARHTRHKNKIA